MYVFHNVQRRTSREKVRYKLQDLTFYERFVARSDVDDTFRNKHKRAAAHGIIYISGIINFDVITGIRPIYFRDISPNISYIYAEAQQYYIKYIA